MSAPFDARRDAQLVFRQSRQAVIIVGTDAPRWTILDVNDAYLAVTHRRREDLLGRGLFEAFPESAGTTHEHGSHHIGASLDAARAGRRDVPALSGKASKSPRPSRSSRRRCVTAR